jgi:hypothetical protein
MVFPVKLRHFIQYIRRVGKPTAFTAEGFAYKHRFIRL